MHVSNFSQLLFFSDNLTYFPSTAAKPSASQPERTNTTPEVSTMKTINIDPAGDMYLVASGGDEPVSFLVCSKVLTLASGVLAALLGPNFREGNVLAQATTPPEIALPADDAVSISILSVAHYRRPKATVWSTPFSAIRRLLLTYSIYQDWHGNAFEGDTPSGGTIVSTEQRSSCPCPGCR
jgi:hypothetical protein